MIYRTLSAIAVSALATTALLVPNTAYARPRPDVAHDHANIAQRAKDGLLTWTIKKHAVELSSTTSGSVVFVYTCGGTEDPVEEQVEPALFQTTYNENEPHAAAYADDDPVFFECDGTEHAHQWVFPATADDTTFENGNGEVSLIRPETNHDATFEHVQVEGLLDDRATASATVDASPEPAKKNKTITVRGTLERDDKAYSGKKATLYYQPDSKGAIKIGSNKADGHGHLKTTVKVTRSGSFFWVTSSTSKTQASASPADHVTVK